MSITPEDVESVFERSDWTQTETIEGPPETAVRQAKVQALLDVLVRVQQLWSTDPDSIHKVVEKLADGARDESWRLPLGDAGMLSFFSSLINVGDLGVPLRKQILRLVGNCCAEMEENRVRIHVSDHLQGVMKQLDDDETLPFATTVLYNIIVDYEPIQVKASQLGLVRKLVDVLTGPRLAVVRDQLEMTYKLLTLLATQDFEIREASLQIPATMLALAVSPTFASEPDDFSPLTTAALLYLSSERLQIEFVNDPGCIPLYLAALETACTTIDLSLTDDDDVKMQIRRMRPNMVSIFADLSAVSSFSVVHPLGSPVMQTLQRWLESRQVHLVSAACLTFGNASRSDGPSLDLVATYKIHAPIIDFLADTTFTDSQVLHCSLSFLKNLAIPTLNKEALGEAGLLDAHLLPRIWSTHPMPEVQFAAVSLTRLLLSNCLHNMRRICAPTALDVVDGDSDAQSTYLQSLLNLYAKSDAEPTKLEASRAVAAVCRELHLVPIADILPPPSAGPAAQYPPPSREAFYAKHASIIHPLTYLVTQSKFPFLRTEVFFILALMSRATDGAHIVSRLFELEAAFKVLHEVVTGEAATAAGDAAGDAAGEVDDHGALQGGKSDYRTDHDDNELLHELGLDDLKPKNVDDRQDKGKGGVKVVVNRENCLVMISELLKRMGTEMASGTRASLSSLLKQGGQIVASAREEQKAASRTIA